jgi:hypothetical protein
MKCIGMKLDLRVGRAVMPSDYRLQVVEWLTGGAGYISHQRFPTPRLQQPTKLRALPQELAIDRHSPGNGIALPVLPALSLKAQEKVLQSCKFIGREEIRDANKPITIECEAIRRWQVLGQSLSSPPGKPMSNSDACSMEA